MKDASEQLATVQSGYDRWSEIYDHDANPLPALEHPIVREWAGEVAGLKALDLGCGTGRHTHWLAEAGAKVAAVDFSKGMLAEAKSKPGAEHVRFVEHDLHEPLPFADGEFDLIVSGLVLEHISDLESLYAEVSRVISGKGRAIISAMHPAMFLRGSQARFTDPDSGEIVPVGSLDHSISAILTAAILAGLRIERIEEFSPDTQFATQYPRAEKYIGYPMLTVMQFSQQQRN